MTNMAQFRPRGSDRRRKHRGGRRQGDIDGFAPLVLLVGEDSSVLEQSETILARLKFAVSTSNTVEDALRVLPDLRPDLVIVGERDASIIRAATHAPVVVMTLVLQESPEALIEDIRRTLRVTPIR